MDESSGKRGASSASDDAASLAARVGLCASCAHARRITSARGSSFWLCERAVREPERFAKYPALPRRECAGWDPEGREPALRR